MYCEKIDIEKFLNKEISESLDFFIKSATQIIENSTQRIFTPNIERVEATERVFSGDNTDTLNIDDCFEITKVEIGNDLYGDTQEELDDEDYITLPLNSASKYKPFDTLKMKYGIFPFGYGNHTVTAKWGYGILPDDIRFACIALASGMYNFSQGGNEIKSESIGGYSVTYAGDQESWSDLKRVKEIIQKYKKYTL